MKERRNRIGPSLGMLYAVVAYLVSAGALFWLFLASSGWLPYGFFDQESAWQSALGWNLALILIFALQHSIMARKAFKRWISRFVADHLERSTYALMSGVCLVFIILTWQPLPGFAWQIRENWLRNTLYAINFLAVGYVFVAASITNQFELFGLRQAYLHWKGESYFPLPFRRILMYRYSRHPMMLGMLVILWSAPQMSLTHLTLSCLLSAYIFAGIQFEEKGLRHEFGQDYEKYWNEVGMFFTFPFRNRSQRAISAKANR